MLYADYTKYSSIYDNYNLSLSPSFYLSNNKHKSVKIVTNYLVNKLNELNMFVDIRPTSKAKMLNSINTIAHSLVRACYIGSPTTQFTLNSNNYSKKYNNLSYTLTKRVLDVLCDNNIINIRLGYWLNEDEYHRTVLEPSTELYDYIKLVIKTNGFKDIKLDFNTVEITDKNKNKLKLNNKQLCGIKEIRDNVVALNTTISKSIIMINNQRAYPLYKRIFRDNLQCGGRFYDVTGFQCEKSHLRRSITIDGVSCVEYDYRAIHPSIAYSLVGVKLPDDPYKLTTQYDYKTSRSIAKLCLLVMFCSDSKEQAVSGLRSALLNHKISVDMTNSKLLDYIHQMEEQHSVIKDYFYSTSWKQMQNVDSEIAMNVISVFNNINECVLCYHDSFVVKNTNEQLLIDTMQKAWYDVVGSLDNFKIVKEY